VTAIVGRLRQIPSWQVTLGFALLALGFLIAAQLRAEGPRIQYTTQERSPLVETATGLQATQDALKQQILDLNDQVRTIQQQGPGSATAARDLNTQLEAARMAAGLLSIQGPGIVLQLADSTQQPATGAGAADYLVTGQDLRTVVAQLWLSGAEAVSINGERVTGSTAIIDIGGSILVNSAYLAPPYQISAIGAPKLYERLSARQGWIDFIRARAETFGIDVKFAESDTVVVPAYAGTVALRYAAPLPGASGAPTGASPSPGAPTSP
jgi:uncharacterized protein YlxW (UPF0749 family)